MNASCFGTVVGKRERAGGVHHACNVDIVFDQDRDAMQRAANLAGLALGIKRLRIGDRGGVHLDDRIEHRTRIVYLPDAVEVRLRERARGKGARRHAIACVDCAELDDVDRGHVAAESGRRGRRRARAGCEIPAKHARRCCSHMPTINVRAIVHG